MYTATSENPSAGKRSITLCKKKVYIFLPKKKRGPNAPFFLIELPFMLRCLYYGCRETTTSPDQALVLLPLQVTAVELA